MLGKSHHVVVILVALVLSTALVVPEATFAIGGPGPPRIIIDIKRGWSITADCYAEHTIKMMSDVGFQGAVNLTAVNLPKGVTTDIHPNPVLVPALGETYSIMNVFASPDTPNGTY